MALRFSLDTSCVLNLLNPDESLDEDLIELLRAAMNNEVGLIVTEAYQTEVADVAPGRRAEVAKRARFLPVIQIPPERLDERDKLAETFFKALWPNSRGDTNMADHGLRDCRHLASHVLIGGSAFVTRDGRLREKVSKRTLHASLNVYSPTQAVAAMVDARPKAPVFVTQSVAVRRATSKDAPTLDSLLTPLRAAYPDFQGWLSRTLSDPNAVVNLGVVDGSSAKGVAIWKPKDARTAKLSTFYLHPEARNLGLGQHLLFHCLRQWVEKRIERAYVTAGAEKEDVLAFCLSFGFRIEGAALRRYSGGGTELVLTKHLSYRSVGDDALEQWLGEVAGSAFSVTPVTGASAADNWFLPPRSVSRSVSWDPTTRRAIFQGEAEHDAFTKTVAELEELFYPVRLALRGRPAYIVPIQPQWAERMMDARSHRATLPLFTFVDKLRLRIDNAYYCAPVYADDDLVGSPILFYVSAPESAITGVARIIDRVIAEAEDLYLRFGQMGIYKLENIKTHVARRGSYANSAMAMHFGWWVPLPQPIPLRRAIETGLVRGHPQRMLRIDYATFEQALQEGGIEW